MTLNLGNIPLGTGPAANVANVEATIQRSMVRLQGCLPPSEFAALQGKLSQIQDSFLRMPQGQPDMSGSYAQGGDVLAQAMALQKGSTAVSDQPPEVQAQVARSIARNKGMGMANQDPARAQADALVKAGIDPGAALSAARGSQSGADSASERARREALADAGIPVDPSNRVQQMEQIKKDNLAAANAAAERLAADNAAAELRRQQAEENAKANNR